MNNELFLEFLIKEMKNTPSTANAYIRDVDQFMVFLKSRGIDNPFDAVNADVVAYLMELKSKGSSKSTVNRKLASVRTYFSFLQVKHGLKDNPARNIKSPKIEKKEMEFLSIEEIEKLMLFPDESPKGIRDRAILELLYATGIRASELIDMELADINLRMGFVTCEGDN
ncbi:MAG: site-specific integrase, partial [Firmicutes bacterium]|nr:site-specific integrase [Bacillota bacterium]